MSPESIRNIAIIAHVDHGKTTLVDELLQQSGTVKNTQSGDRVMDSNALEKERGITILAKNTAINWRDHHINIVDTPGHADFGGEVERILSMVDSVLLLVDAVDGPMPQTRFVTQKAFEHNLHPIVVVNKIDRPQARPDWAVDQVFDLFDRLGATDEQLDFPIIYTSAINGYAQMDLVTQGTDMKPLLDILVDQVSPPDVDVDAPFQCQISALDYSSYVGTIGIGRISRGSAKVNQSVKVIDRDGNVRSGRLAQIMGHIGLERVKVNEAFAGDIIGITGLEPLSISDTICDPDHIEALPALSIDEPTVTMTFQVNDSPFAGKEGKFVTSRQLHARLQQELIHNVALRVEETDSPDRFIVSGRGELHLSILIETMRREGYELAVSRPEVILREVDDAIHEPYEYMCVEVDSEFQGAVMETLGARQAQLKDMQNDGSGRVRLEFTIPARGLIGLHTSFQTATSGTGIITHTFDHYGPYKGQIDNQRKRGAMIANGNGKAVGFALFNLQERGRMLIAPQTDVYEGMMIGLHTRENDLVVNVQKAKQLTNIRASGTDENIQLTPIMKLSLEQALETINDDELLEITPEHIRLRKKFLKEHERKRASRSVE